MTRKNFCDFFKSAAVMQDGEELQTDITDPGEKNRLRAACRQWALRNKCNVKVRKNKSDEPATIIKGVKGYASKYCFANLLNKNAGYVFLCEYVDASDLARIRVAASLFSKRNNCMIKVAKRKDKVFVSMAPRAGR